VGNIGEGLGLAGLLSISGIRPYEVTRVRRRKELQIPEAQRTPDFVANVAPPRAVQPLITNLLTRHVTARFAQRVAITPALVAFPPRFPIEAKGTMKPSPISIWSGIWQLVEYWYSCVQSGQALDEVGYGLLLHTIDIGDQARCVTVFVFAPRDQNAVSAALQVLVANRGGRAAFVEQFGVIAGGAFLGSALN
jgi:hypothetical protein